LRRSALGNELNIAVRAFSSLKRSPVVPHVVFQIIEVEMGWECFSLIVEVLS